MIIGFCGFASAGKDESARGLPGFTRRAFADELKREVQAFTRSHYMIDAATNDPAEKSMIRWLLVGHGRTMRKLNPDYWVDHVSASMQRVVKGAGKMEDLEPIPGNFAITDVRYANECEFIEKQGGSVILITRPGYGPANDEEHGSIMDVIQRGLIARTIENNGTIEELHAKVQGAAA